MAVSLNGTNGITFNDSSTQNTAATGFGFKNRIINGAMVIDQRNAGASVTPASAAYTLDRWQYYASQASKFTVQQNAGSVTPPSGFINYLGATVASAVSIGASDYFFLSQRIEGFNTADLAFGTASAQTVTLSFWVRSSLTGSFGGALQNSAVNRNYPFSFTINSANTWEYKTVTIAGDTTGTWVTNNGIGLIVVFNLGTGSSFSAAAGSWTSSGVYAPTGATSVVGTNGATFYITGVQLEKGSTATSFDYRPYGTELQLCQRYLPAFISTSTSDSIGCGGAILNTTTGYITLPFKVSARTAPTGVTVSSAANISVYTPRSGSIALSSVTFGGIGASTESCSIGFTVASGLTAYDSGFLYYTSASGKLLFTGCEL